MSTATVNKVMQQRLTRGTPVTVADSFGQAKLRGKDFIVTSKGPVKCNKGGRCAGDWCVGLAVFVASAKSAKTDKAMGWRKNTTKICLTHLKDDGGVLLLPPPFIRQRAREAAKLADESPVSRIKDLVAEPELVEPMLVTRTNGHSHGSAEHDIEVTWHDLAVAHQQGDIKKLSYLARKLKTQTEILKNSVIDNQKMLIGHLTGTGV